MPSVSWQNALTFCLILAILLTMFALATPALAVDVAYSFGDAIVYPLPITASSFSASADAETFIYFMYPNTRSTIAWFRVFSSSPSSVTYSGGTTIRSNISSGDFYCSNAALSTGITVEELLDLGFTVNPHISNADWVTYVGTNALSTYVPPPDDSTGFFYSLPPGNVAYISVPSSTFFSLSCRMPESVLGSNHFPGNNQVVTLVSSIPSSGQAPSSPLIPWEQNGALSILGLSRNALYESTTASSGYLCIVNPLYYSGTANGPYEFLSNGAIDIIVQSASGIVVRPLDSTLGFTSGLGVDVTTDILPDSYTGVVDSVTGEITWTDPSGGESAPSAGGGNLVSTGETIFDFLRNIADEIATFLRGPINAVKTVVAALRDFMTSFVELYQWLPAPVYNLITAGLMIAVTIGVIKIFV